MTTYETLKTYREKCETAMEQVSNRLIETRKALESLEKQQFAIGVQIDTLDSLMDTEKNPPIVELPFAGEENIQEQFDKRLETHDGSSPEETYGTRQDTVYRQEAMESVEKLDAVNRSEED